MPAHLDDQRVGLHDYGTPSMDRRLEGRLIEGKVGTKQLGQIRDLGPCHATPNTMPSDDDTYSRTTVPSGASSCCTV